MNKRYRLNHSIANTSIFWFFSAAYRYFVHQTRANALKQGSQSIAMLEKLQKYSYRLLWKIEIVPFLFFCPKEIRTVLSVLLQELLAFLFLSRCGRLQLPDRGAWSNR